MVGVAGGYRACGRVRQKWKASMCNKWPLLHGVRTVLQSWHGRERKSS